MFDTTASCRIYERNRLILAAGGGGREGGRGTSSDEKVEMETETEQVFRGRFRALLPG